MKFHSLLFLTTLFIQVASAQGITPSRKSFGRTTQEASVTFSSNGNLNAVAISALQYWGLGQKRQPFQIGLGGRLTSSFGNDKNQYITAPAKFTSGKVGPAVFFAPQIPENIDTVYLDGTQVNSVNLYLALRYEFLKKWGVEFNIDLFGLSLGGSKLASIQYDEGKKEVSRTRPTPGNALLISDNDIGSLNSELMFSYWHRKNVKFKAGIVFLFNEYDMNTPVTYTNSKGTLIDNDRYRTKSLQYGVGFIYVLENKFNKNLNLKK